MTPHKRLWLLFTVILVSAGYAVMIKRDPELANAIWLFYVAFLLTMLTVNHVWKREQDE